MTIVSDYSLTLSNFLKSLDSWTHCLLDGAYSWMATHWTWISNLKFKTEHFFKLKKELSELIRTSDKALSCWNC